MKTCLIASVIFCSIVAVAESESNVVNMPNGQEAKVVRKTLTPEEVAERKAKMQEVVSRKLGGFVVRPNTLKGEIVYLNCQKRLPQSVIDKSVKYFADKTHFNVTAKVGSFDMRSPKIEGNASIFIVDDSTLPALLVAPENRWALVNVAELAKETRPAYFEARGAKELSRAFSYLCGAVNSQYPRSLTRGIMSQSELDVNPDASLPVDILQRFVGYMAGLGVTPAEKISYKKACEEGWAAQPTNEYQKAIWDKVHEVPTEPLKIKPENHPAK